MSKTEYQKMSGNIAIKWYCARTDCIDPSTQPLALLSSQMSAVLTKLDHLLGKVTKIDNISSDIATIKTEMSEIKAGLAVLEPRVSKIEDRLNTVENKIELSSNSEHSALETTIAEMNERARRSKNLMVFNLAESSAADVQTRMRSDLDMVNKLLNPFMPSFTTDGIKTLRVGKKLPGSVKPRPLKVILSSQSDVAEFLRSFSADAAARVHQAFSSVKVSRDRTPCESKHLQTLNSELKERVSKGETNLTIKFINNVPQIVKSQKN